MDNPTRQRIEQRIKHLEQQCMEFAAQLAACRGALFELRRLLNELAQAEQQEPPAEG